MAKSTDRKALHLYIVGEDPSPTIKRPTDSAPSSFDPFEDLEKAAYVVHPEIAAAEAKRQRVPRSKEEFAVIPLSWLNDRKWDTLLSGRVRLYLFLQWKTKRGARPWPLSNVEAASLGLPRQNKMRVLRWLEAKGLVTVATVGKETVTISVVPQSPAPNDVRSGPE